MKRGSYLYGLTVGIIILLFIVSCKNSDNTVQENVSMYIKVKEMVADNISIEVIFYMHQYYKKEKNILARMDKELSQCFMIENDAQEITPIAAERVENGKADEIVFMLYFKGISAYGKKKLLPKLIYKDRFFDLQAQVFYID